MVEPPVADEEWMPRFYVGQHESRRPLPITSHTLRLAVDCNVGGLLRLCERFANSDI